MWFVSQYRCVIGGVVYLIQLEKHGWVPFRKTGRSHTQISKTQGLKRVAAEALCHTDAAKNCKLGTQIPGSA